MLLAATCCARCTDPDPAPGCETVVSQSAQAAAALGATPLQVLRTGTDNVAYGAPLTGSGLAQGVQAAHGNSAQPNYDGMAVPSVWRTNRTQAAAKVDASLALPGK